MFYQFYIKGTTMQVPTTEQIEAMMVKKMSISADYHR